MTSTQQTERLSRRLRIVRMVALIDLFLLLALVSVALTGQRKMVQILGPLHGINFLLLLVMVGVGAIDGVWEWWFPVAVLLTAGPPGAFLGEWIMHRRVRTQKALIHAAASDETAVVAAERETGTSDVPSPATEAYVRDERKEQG